MKPTPRAVGIDLFWLPLGAGGRFVRFNGRVYEVFCSWHEHRPAVDLFHTALEVTVPEGRFVIENAWPIPDANGATRGVAVEGPVFARRFGRFRVFRYEIRRWRDGLIAGLSAAIESPRRLSDDEDTARRLLEIVATVPSLVWGRHVLGLGESGTPTRSPHGSWPEAV